MLDFLGNTASVLITFVVVVGFFALGALLVFELGTMFAFWKKHSWRGSSGRNEGFTPRTAPRKQL